MRVLMVGPFPADMDNPIGGVEAATANLVIGLGQLPDLEIEVISNSAISGERTVSYPFGSVTYIPMRPRFRGWARDIHIHLVREARRRKADVVHVQGLASLAARLPGSVLTVHGMTERDIWESGEGASRVVRYAGAWLLEGIPRRSSRRVIAISEHVSEQIEHFGNKIWNIPNAIHPRYFSASRVVRRGDPNVFITAGAISPIKNTAAVITAFRQVAQTNDAARLVLAGGGLDTDYGRECAELVDRIQLQKHVTFVGQQSGAQVAELLFGAGTLVQFSTQDNAPMAVAEALAAGAAVIGSNAGGIPGMLRDLPGCHAVSVGNTHSLSDRLLGSASTEDEACAQHRHEAALQYSPGAVAQQTLAVYREVAGSSASQVGQQQNYREKK
jgi:glycosyltransferase involved in cell wall biosynthesis